MAGIDASAADVQGVYERQAAAFDKQRGRSLFEARWLARFAACLPQGGRVLDLGCGAGEPIAQWFKAEGFAVTGVDFSQSLLAIAQTRWPDGDWHHGDMRTLDLDQTFDGIIGWNSFFHLTQDDQRACIPRFARHLSCGGSLMLTVGHIPGEVSGNVGSERIYHASLSTAEYVTLLEQNGLRLTGYLAQDPDTNEHSVLMARKEKE